MEDSKFLKLFLVFAIAATFAFFAAPKIVLSYSPESTHAALAKNAAELFKLNFENSLSAEDVESIIDGAIKEDAPSYRVLNHFYDPIYNRGLTFAGNWKSSREWSEDNFAQASLDVNYTVRNFAGLTNSSHFGGATDYSWQRSIYEYAWGDRARGLRGLGHTLHLIQDATVPDHTRNDHHFPYLEAQLHDSSPYEQWTSNYNRENFKLSASLKPNIYKSLREYFDDTATYSNKYFFSRHTIFDRLYFSPAIISERVEKLSNGKMVNFLYTSDGKNTYRLVGKRSNSRWQNDIEKKDLTEYFIEDFDKFILEGYWNLLSKKAVTNGAGVIKLFFDEVEKEKETKILYHQNRSWFAQKIDEFKSGTFAVASILYGSSVKESDLAEEPVRNPEPTLEKTLSADLISESAAKSNANDEASIQVVETEASPPLALVNEVPALTTPAIPEVESIPGISLPPPLGSFMGGGGAPTPEPEPEVSEPPAIVVPTISLSVDQCAASLATNGCLIRETALTISWTSSSSDISRYEITCLTAGAPCAGFSYSEIGTSTAYTAADGSAYTFRAKSINQAGTESEATEQTVSINSRPVVINEIAWMGTSETRPADEWIELFNRTEFTIDLSNWTLYSQTDIKPYLTLSGTISPNSYYLIERTDDAATSIAADFTAAFGSGTGAGLSNSGEVLVLAYGSTTIDQTPALCNASWCGGNNTNYFTMERYDPNALGNASSNWGTNNQSVAYGQNADGVNIWGTPRRRNSLNHRIILNSGTTLTESKTLTAAMSPYVVSESITIASGTTLAIEPGVTAKFSSNGELKINGILEAEGRGDAKIIFTSIKDDVSGGDTNGDGTASTPTKGDWKKLTFKGAGSTLSHAEVRYGGRFSNSDASESRAMVFASGAPISISNSVIEESYNMGISLSYASSSVIQESRIRNNNNATGAGFSIVGLSIGGGESITVSGNTFESNRRAISITNATPRLIGNTFSENLETPIELHSGSAGTVFERNTAAANPFNGVVVSHTITNDAELSADLPYTGTFNVSASGALTIPSGAILKGVRMIISGLLNIRGDSANLVVITALSDDSYGGDDNSDGTTTPEPGSWEQIEIRGNAATSTISNALFRYGNGGTTNAALYINGGAAEIDNSVFEYSKVRGIKIASTAVAKIQNSSFSNNDTGITNEGWLELAASTFRNNTTGIISNPPSTFIDGGGNDIDSSNTTRTTPSTLIN